MSESACSLVEWCFIVTLILCVCSAGVWGGGITKGAVLNGAPIPAEEFDYHNPAQLRRMLKWGGTDRVVANYAGVSETCITKQRRKHNIPPAAKAYQGRAVYEVGDTPAPASDDSEHLAALLEYFQDRRVPDAPAPTASRHRGPTPKRSWWQTCITRSPTGGRLRWS